LSKNRVELHCHTHYSLMDGLNTPDEMVRVAKSFDMPAISITDHGSLSGHRDLQSAAAEHGVKPILGVEAYISPTDRFDRRPVTKREDNTSLYNHIILLAKNQNGLKNLNQMSREAWVGGYYNKPRIDWELLDEYGDDMFILSGCMNGLIPKAFERGDIDEAYNVAKKFKGRFGDNFLIEVQAHNPPALNAFLLEMADKHNMRPVATTDCHFTRPELRWVEEAMLILSTSPKKAAGKDYASTSHIKDTFERFRDLYPDRPISFEDIDVYLMNREELEEGFSHQNIVREDIYENTLWAAEQVDSYTYLKNEDFLPRTVEDPDAELRDKVFLGLDALGLSQNSEYVERAKEELAIIAKKRFSPYFLIVGDMVEYAKDAGIFVGPGRGSAAGSLVCYSLGITSVDPIKYNLLFFRFIDESRDDWPDIDTDFEKSRRGEIKEYLRNKYGYVASISNFIYFKDKGVIRDAARVYAVPMDEVNKALKQIDTWNDYLTTSAKDCVDFRTKYPEVTELASELRGRIRNVGLHAAGIVTSSVPIEDYAPFETRSDPSDKISGRIPAIAWDMDQCADVGLIKLDVLGLTTLDVLHDTIKFIENRHDKKIDLNSLPLDDKRVFSNLTQGNTVGVFQADAAPYTSLLQEMGVDNFEDLIASNALVRPGARNTVGADFIRRKKGLEKVSYVHPIMEPVLEGTYGTIVYQEQVMLAATMLGGLSNSEANKLRKIIGKKRDASEFDEYRDRFIEGATKHISNDAAVALWHDFEAHAGYSFNRSHAVAYSLLSYWTMWLKIYYPIEFMTALFRNESDAEKKTSIFIEMRRLGIKVKTPHVNESDAHAKIVSSDSEDYIRLGLTDIKYISDKVFAHIDRERPYESAARFRAYASKKGSGISSQAIQSLNAVGALEFKDNKRKGDEPNNYYEYLKIPRFAGKPLPQEVLDVITNVDEYHEEGTYIIKGMVKSFKRGKSAAGKEWVRVEIVDETGNIGAFCDPGNTPVAGQMYIMLITWNRIMKYIPVDEFDENNKEHFVQFMHGKGAKPKVGELEVLAVEIRFTAKRQLMATVVVANSQREMRRVFVFPATYSTNAGKIKEGRVLRAKLGKSQDGTMFIKEIDK
jgi:DNA polymerase-3 subunit alpha